ncbi:putative Late nodulin [Medicago truncatula]|uniref:Putative Late nodulin n=1 Tax=Medicago truncatula TaxID=3880 RepID=A0A396JR48_MEDTR|nr:putative Late nodulin [Medicago truncatula]
MQKVDNMAEIPKFSYTLIIFISLFVVITCFRKPFNPIDCEIIADCKYKACHRPLTAKCVNYKCECVKRGTIVENNYRLMPNV